VTDIVTRTLAADHITPVRAYAALRSHVKDRSSFLIEALPSAGERGRYTVLGYRVRREAIYPGGGNAFELLEGDVAGTEPAATFAARIAQSLVGFFAYDVVHAIDSVDPWPNEGEIARMMRDAIIVVFDHAEQTLTIAGATKGALDRCEYEMARGPALPSLKVPEATALPEFAEPLVDDDAFTVKVRRAAKLIEEGEASHMVLARAFRAPMRGADPFDVYRALRVLAPSRCHFFLEYGHMPIAEGFAVIGSAEEILARAEGARLSLRPTTTPRGAASDDAINQAEHAEHASLVDRARAEIEQRCEPGSVSMTADRVVERYGEKTRVASEITGTVRADASGLGVIRAVFPSGSVTGSPRPRVTQAIRDLEASPRRAWGGVVGYATPGGNFELAVASTAIVARRGYFETHGGARLEKGTDPEGVAKATWADARAALASIRAGQDLAKAREEAEAAARAKEEEAARAKEQAEKAES
jgi:anthranilate synthase component 1